MGGRRRLVALDAGGSSLAGGVVVVMVLWGLGAGSLTAFRLGRRLQSSIRSRGADQSVVRCSGAQSSARPSCSVCEEEARHRSELARACTSRPGRARESGVSWRWSCGLGQLVVVVVDVGLVL